MSKFLDKAGLQHFTKKIKDGSIVAGKTKEVIEGGSVPASAITGVIDISHIPQGALERVVQVATEADAKLLTKSNIQLGDTLKITGTGKMYIVVDESKLSADGKTAGTMAAFMEYASGSASSVPWSGVTGKPSSLGGYGIGDGVNAAGTSGTGNAVTGLSVSGHKLTGALGSFLNALNIGGVEKVVGADGKLTFSLNEIPQNIPAVYKDTIDECRSTVALYKDVDKSAASNGPTSILLTVRHVPGELYQYMLSDGVWTKRLISPLAPNGRTDWEPITDLPEGKALVAGLYKITTSEGGRVTAGTAVTKADITALGIPSKDTTYTTASGSADGLMPKGMYTKLNGVASGATADSALSDTEIDEAIAAAG